MSEFGLGTVVGVFLGAATAYFIDWHYRQRERPKKKRPSENKVKLRVCNIVKNCPWLESCIYCKDTGCYKFRVNVNGWWLMCSLSENAIHLMTDKEVVSQLFKLYSSCNVKCKIRLK